MVIIILKYNNRKYLINEFLRLFLSQIFMVLNFATLIQIKLLSKPLDFKRMRLNWKTKNF